MAIKKQRPQRATLLAVGEGDSEVCFLKYLRSLYCANSAGVSVTVMNAHGKGPGNVVNTAVGHRRMRAYDRALALLDTDLEWTKKDLANARKGKIELLGSSPCLEGLLLTVLGHPVPEQSRQCKVFLEKIIDGDLTQLEVYSSSFSKPTLEAARQTTPTLDMLLRYLEGGA